MNSQKQQLNLELIELIQQIKQLQPKSKERRKLINRLFKRIQPQFIQKSQAIFSGQDKFLIEDAQQETYINIQKYIHTYKPEKSKFMTWVITIFKNNFGQLLEKHKKAYITRIPRQIADSSEEENKLDVVSLDAKNYDDFLASDNKQLAKKIREFLKADPENILKNKKIRNQDLSLQDILLYKQEGYTFKEIGEYFSISPGTVSSFYDRNLKDPEIRQYFSRYLDLDEDY